MRTVFVEWFMPNLRLENDLHPVRGRVMRHFAKMPPSCYWLAFPLDGGMAMFMFGYFSLIVCLFIRKNWKSEPARCFPLLLFLLVIYKLHIILGQLRDERCHRNSPPDTMCSIPNIKLLSLRAPHNSQACLRDWLAQGSNTTVTECLSHACAETHSKSVSGSRCLQSSYSQQHRETMVQNSPVSGGGGGGLPASAPGSAVLLHSPGL